MSHPVWVCGLKQIGKGEKQFVDVTPCMGVWIETDCIFPSSCPAPVTPCMGVWIETHSKRRYSHSCTSHPVWVCGLKPTLTSHGISRSRHTLYGCVDWNGMRVSETPYETRSHPVWVCGLKPATLQTLELRYRHTLYGCVDWNGRDDSECSAAGCHTLYGCVDWNWYSYADQRHIEVTPCMGVWIETRQT